MSVVNRMLQDIDRRIGAAAIDARSTYPDVRSVPSQAPRGRRNAWLAGGAVLLVAIGAMVAAGWGEGRLWMKDPGAAVPPTTVATVPVAAAPKMEPPAPAGRAPEPATIAATAEERQSMPEPTPAPAPPSPIAVRQPIDSFKLSLILSPPMSVTPSGEFAKPPATTRPPGEVAKAPATGKSPVAVRQVAAGETVVSARQLWNEGSREGAIATLRDALAAAEASRDQQAARSLALELARLEVAGNRAQAALELLRRQASLYGEDADALALRGNAQQRLAMHSEAAESYLAALRLRPTEGRWMLGAAISLVADGKVAEAQSWADRARERGAITPSIAAYLQQLGIAARP